MTKKKVNPLSVVSIGSGAPKKFKQFETELYNNEIGDLANNVNTVINRNTKQYFICRIDDTSVSDSGTKRNDDYKTFIFYKSYSYPKNYKFSIGQVYEWNNDYWLAYASNVKIGVEDQLYMRRCNAQIPFMKDEYNNIYYEPIVMDKNILTRTVFNQNSTMVTIDGNQEYFAQSNKYTRTLENGKRIIMGGILDDVNGNQKGQAFMLRGLMNFQLNSKDKNDSSVIQFNLELTEELVGLDDLYNNIASGMKNDWQLDNDISNLKGFVGLVGSLNIHCNMNGKERKNEALEYISSDETICKIDKSTGEYEMLSDGECVLTTYLIKNTDIKVEIPCIVEIKTLSLRITVDPIAKEIKEYQKQKFYVKVFDYDELLDVNFNVLASNAPSRSFKISTDNKNTFEIECVENFPKRPLEIEISSEYLGEKIRKKIEVMLKPEF